jgi:hypothetical protein
MRQNFPINRQLFQPYARCHAMTGNIFPHHKLPEIRPMPDVLIFDRRFLCHFLIEIEPVRIGSIFRHPRQAQRRLEIEPMCGGPIYQWIFHCSRR